ncbi:brevican core protein-like [Mytilus edulis]|uniref:brevican core protein-like n=1 Tax=Mytilus edulis TaxID=6550 RepID=UPI0039EEE5D4
MEMGIVSKRQQLDQRADNSRRPPMVFNAARKPFTILPSLVKSNIYQDVSITPCTNTPCLFNGTCTVTGESYVCVCPDGFNGQQCEVPCNTATGYTYDTSMNICYKAVVTSRDYTSAKEQCVSDSAHLLLIDSVDVYGWAVNLMDAYGIQRIYFQAERIDQYSPFLDDEGNNLTYFNWNPGEPGVEGNYLRTDGTTRLMETSSGNSEYSYICQIY